jgi:hypothetical protein
LSLAAFARGGDGMASKTAEKAREIARRLLKEGESVRQEAEARGERFESLDKEALLAKLMGRTTDSPFFNGQSWGSGAPGGTATYRAFIHNPSPADYSDSSLFAYLFFGPANFMQSPDLALTTVDVRFPRFFRSLGVAAGDSANATFTINIPSGITPGIYMGNCFLVRRNWFDIGDYFDRAAFDLTVSRVVVSGG